MRSKAVPNGSIEPRNCPTARIEASHVFASLKRLAIAALGAALRAAGVAVACLRGIASLARLALLALLGREYLRTRFALAERRPGPSSECLVSLVLDELGAAGARLSAHVA